MVGDINKLYDIYLQRKKPVELPCWLIETDKGLEISPQELFIYLKETLNIRSVKLGHSKGIVLYRYNPKGRYELWTESDAKADIKEYIPIRIRKPYQTDMIYKEFCTERADTEESQFNADENIVNFQNGILDLKTGKLLPHDPKYLSTIQLNCNYIENVKPSQLKRILDFLKYATGGNADDIATILEVIGLIVTNVYGWRFKQLLIILGAGDTGKSKLMKLVIEIIREENFFATDMNKINSQFGRAGIVGKRLVGSGDMSISRVDSMETIKELTGGDRINVEAKFQNSYTTEFRGFLWFNTNKLPTFGGDHGEHIFERLLILSFDNVVPKEKRDPNIVEKLLKEKDALVSLSIEYLKKAIDRGHKFTESDRTKKNREKYERRINSLKFFIKERCKLGEGRTSTTLFKAEYKKFCKENDLMEERTNNISKMLETEFGITKKKSNREYYELTIKY